MNLEIKKAVEAEFERCDTLRKIFADDEVFAVYAIIKGWSIEQAEHQYALRKPKLSESQQRKIAGF